MPEYVDPDRDRTKHPPINADVDGILANTGLRPLQGHKYGWDQVRRIANLSTFAGDIWTGKPNTPIDRGEAFGTNAANVKTDQWCPEIDTVVPGLTNMLPVIQPTNTIVGVLSRFFQQRFGFPKGTYYVNNTGDNPGSIVGQGITNSKQTGGSLGSSGTLYGHVDKQGLDAALKAPVGNVFGEPTGEWMDLICTQNCTLALEAVRNSEISVGDATERLKSDGKQISDKAIDDMRWTIFDEEVAKANPGNEGNVMIPMTKDEKVVRIPYNPNKPHANFDFENAPRPTKLRAAAEGMIYLMKYASDLAGLKPTEINLTGGAAKNKLIRQIVADIFGATVKVVKDSGSGTDIDTAALGSAINAAVAIGREQGKGTTFEEITGKVIQYDNEKTTAPISANVGEYAKHLGGYVDLVQTAMKTEPTSISEEKKPEEDVWVTPQRGEGINRWGEVGAETLDMLRNATGKRLVVGMDQSTQSTTLVVLDVESGKVVLQIEEKYNDPTRYKQYNCPKGVMPHPDNPTRFHTNPLLLAAAQDSAFLELRDAFKAYGWDMSLISGVSGAFMQHGNVRLNERWGEVLENLNPQLPLAPQLKPALALPSAPMWMNGETQVVITMLENAFGGAEATKMTTGSTGQERFLLPAAVLDYQRYAGALP